MTTNGLHLRQINCLLKNGKLHLFNYLKSNFYILKACLLQVVINIECQFDCFSYNIFKCEITYGNERESLNQMLDNIQRRI